MASRNNENSRHNHESTTKRPRSLDGHKIRDSPPPSTKRQRQTLIYETSKPPPARQVKGTPRIGYIHGRKSGAVEPSHISMSNNETTVDQEEAPVFGEVRTPLEADRWRTSLDADSTMDTTTPFQNPPILPLPWCSVPPPPSITTSRTPFEPHLLPRPKFDISGPSRGNGAGTLRTASVKKMLRDKAAELLAGQADLEFEDDEINGGRGRMYPEVCWVIVDRDSAEGRVAVYDHGIPTQQVDTGPGVTGERYRVLIVREGQICVVHGYSTVLYYKRSRALQRRDATKLGKINTSQVVKSSPPVPEIIIRLQIDETGKFSAPYNISALRPKSRTIEFFDWFGRQTNHGGERGPPLLEFILKDAMPVPKSRAIARLNEDDFRYVKKDIMTQFDKAKLYMPGLKEFVVLVTDPEWASPVRRR